MAGVSDVQKIRWVTEINAVKKPLMVNTSNLSGAKHVPDYEVKRLGPRVRPTSFGLFDLLAPELMSMVIRLLSCADLEGIRQCCRAGRETVLAINSYSRVLSHAPTILSVLKITQLDKSFTIEEVHHTLVNRGCTTCGQFGGFVFLPSFTRCCQNCAETNANFMPISAHAAKKAFGIKSQRALDSLPHMKTMPNFYTTNDGSYKNCSKRSITLLSRDLAQKLRNPSHVINPKHDPVYVAENTIRAYQRYMAITPLPWYCSTTGYVEHGLRCGGCILRAKGHNRCQVFTGTLFRNVEEMEVAFEILPDESIPCSIRNSGSTVNQCSRKNARDILYDGHGLLAHVRQCKWAQHIIDEKSAEARTLARYGQWS